MSFESLSPWEEGEPECECPPQPPQFLVPPPPAPPSLCKPGGQPDLQFCEAEPVGAEFTAQAFPSLPIIAVCSSVVLVAVFVASFLLWKHKKKVQNFLPCKSQKQGPCSLGGTNGVTYDDVLMNHHPTRLPNHHHGTDTHTLTPIELLDVKYGSYGPPHIASLSQTNYTFRPALHQDHHPHHHHPHPHHHHHHHRSNRNGRAAKNKEHFNPIYEEVSGHSDDKPDSRSYDSDIEDSEVEVRTIASEDEFAEDELSLGEYPRPPASGTSSLQGSTGGDLCPIEAGSSDGGGGHSDGAAHQDGRSLTKSGKGSSGRKSGRRPTVRPTAPMDSKNCHSLERNKDSIDSLQAKQNYYLSKSALAFNNATEPPSFRDSGLPYSATTSSADLEPATGVSPPEPAPFQPGYGVDVIPTVYNPGCRVPGFMLPGDVIGRPPPPPNPGGRPPPQPPFMGPDCKYPPGFSTFLPQHHPASTENIYASIDDDAPASGPFTIDGAGRHHHLPPTSSMHRRPPGGLQTSRPSAEGNRGPSTPFTRTVSRDSVKNSAGGGSARSDDSSAPPYGDIRPLFDASSRTVCT